MTTSESLRGAALSTLLLVSACGGDGPSGPSNTIPSYAGNWTGTYAVTGCSQSGQVALANLCATIIGSPPYQFSLTQSDRNVSGTFSLGGVPFPNTSGTVAQNGTLALSATSATPGVNIVANWALNISNSVLAGTVTQQWTSPGLTGSATINGTINSAIRGASTSDRYRLTGTMRTLGEVRDAMLAR